MKKQVEPYLETLAKIKQFNFHRLSDEEILHTSRALRAAAQGGTDLTGLLPEAYALAAEAAARVLKQSPYNEQLIAAVTVHQGKVAELQTGEGKTLMAVMPAYLNALTGKGVHVLTFNDYLARRDAEWMGPIYALLGLEAAYVKEGMGLEQRRRAYAADITYVTAKEAGFDYLRDFLCTDQNQLVHRELNFAILDEADSILIDEARIPLVIAGRRDDKQQPESLRELVLTLRKNIQYQIDQNKEHIYLTDSGLLQAEELLGCGNLYSEQNHELLARLNSAMEAEFLLQRDKDYIVRDGKIELIDEFTGRIADNRHLEDTLHAAVEAKEGIYSGARSIILGSIALQHYISLYAKLAGMTGTAQAAAEELRSYYNLEAAVIPTHKPCIRQDHEDEVFKTIEEKHRAVVEEVTRVHRKGQPILIGTGSIEESEQLFNRLEKAGIPCKVLNARNDEQEAEIIARAGEIGAVTVSTNMAGRGVDIKLGGSSEGDQERVASLGGLYILGTNRHESRRIDQQLRGRAGRQGDPGESRFFISLEDDWIKKHGIMKALPAYYSNLLQGELRSNADVRQAITKGQRLVEGYYGDMRMQQWKYSFILEQQRRIIHQWRRQLLVSEKESVLLQEKLPQRWSVLEQMHGTALLCKVEKQLTLYYINKHWADYLDYMSYTKDSIHLVVIGRQNPHHEFNKRAIEAFEELKENINRDIIEAFGRVHIRETGVDLEAEGLKSPGSTWTYLIHESPDQFSNFEALLKSAFNGVKGPLFTLQSLFKRLIGLDKQSH